MKKIDKMNRFNEMLNKQKGIISTVSSRYEELRKEIPHDKWREILPELRDIWSVVDIQYIEMKRTIHKVLKRRNSKDELVKVNELLKYHEKIRELQLMEMEYITHTLTANGSSSIIPPEADERIHGEYEDELSSSSTREMDYVDSVHLHHLHYLLTSLLPVVKHINKEQTDELFIEADVQGVPMSSMKVKQGNCSTEGRIYCNYCSTSIFDLYRSCSKCNYEVCLNCCLEIRKKEPLQKQAEFSHCAIYNVCHLHVGCPQPNTSNIPNWVLKDGNIVCPVCPKETGGCGDSLLELTHILQEDWISTLEKNADCILKTIKPPHFKSVPLEPNCHTCLRAAQREGSDDFLYCPSPKDILEMDDLIRFRQHWREGQPVEMSALDFFVGYTKGVWNDDSQPMMLKLKDFLPEHSFEKVLPRHYDEFICALPLREYTDPKTGVFNIASKLPQHIIKPDLGPKSYIAYGNTQEVGRGDSVTHLHCDIADAVNILLHTAEVSVSDMGVEFRETDGAGALWDIFRREDVKKLEEYLLNHQKEFQHPCGCPIDKVYNPIYDQIFYLTSEHKRKLKAEHGVEPWTFTQHLGEAVLIPAGCPHQVRNLKSCTKVAMDFISSESIQECIRLTQEFRKLPDGHHSEEDKLEVKKLSLSIR